jgi:hypothetical protein
MTADARSLGLDPRFLERLKTGHRFAEQVADRFRDYGLPVETTAFTPQPAGDPSRFHDEHDLEVAGKIVEVKSRSVDFTGAHDFPYPTAFVYRTGGWENKRRKPAAIVLVSQNRGGFAVVRVSDFPHWQRRQVFDREMRFQYEAFEIEARRLVQFEELVRWLGGQLPGGGIL